MMGSSVASFGFVIDMMAVDQGQFKKRSCRLWQNGRWKEGKLFGMAGGQEGE